MAELQTPGPTDDFEIPDIPFPEVRVDDPLAFINDAYAVFTDRHTFADIPDDENAELERSLMQVGLRKLEDGRYVDFLSLETETEDVFNIISPEIAERRAQQRHEQFSDLSDRYERVTNTQNSLFVAGGRADRAKAQEMKTVIGPMQQALRFYQNGIVGVRAQEELMHFDTNHGDYIAHQEALRRAPFIPKAA